MAGSSLCGPDYSGGVLLADGPVSIMRLAIMVEIGIAPTKPKTTAPTSAGTLVTPITSSAMMPVPASVEPINTCKMSERRNIATPFLTTVCLG